MATEQLNELRNKFFFTTSQNQVVTKLQGIPETIPTPLKDTARWVNNYLHNLKNYEQFPDSNSQVITNDIKAMCVHIMEAFENGTKVNFETIQKGQNALKDMASYFGEKSLSYQNTVDALKKSKSDIYNFPNEKDKLAFQGEVKAAEEQASNYLNLQNALMERHSKIQDNTINKAGFYEQFCESNYDIKRNSVLAQNPEFLKGCGRITERSTSYTDLDKDLSTFRTDFIKNNVGNLQVWGKVKKVCSLAIDIVKGRMDIKNNPENYRYSSRPEHTAITAAFQDGLEQLAGAQGRRI